MRVTTHLSSFQTPGAESDALIDGTAKREYNSLLARRFRESSKAQPELRNLRRILLKLGGEEIVPPPSRDPMTNFLIDFGIVFSGPVVLKESGRCQPEHTLGRIWRRRLHGVVGIGAGYALHDDGLWREHFFGVLREGVLEIFALKRKYFGLLLVSEAADAFAETLRRSPGA
jgi:hypothetical protein